MSEPRVWDIGDLEPTDCDRVESGFRMHTEEEAFCVSFTKTRRGGWVPNTYSIDEYWDWPDVVRRFGPVREVKQ